MYGLQIAQFNLKMTILLYSFYRKIRTCIGKPIIMPKLQLCVTRIVVVPITLVADCSNGNVLINNFVIKSCEFWNLCPFVMYSYFHYRWNCKCDGSLLEILLINMEGTLITSEVSDSIIIKCA